MAQTSNSKQNILGLTRVQLYWTLAAVAVYLLFNLFYVGDAEVVIVVNHFALLPLVVAVMVMAVRVWRRIKDNRKIRGIWLHLLIGWALWTAAEFWWVTASLTQE